MHWYETPFGIGQTETEPMNLHVFSAGRDPQFNALCIDRRRLAALAKEALQIVNNAFIAQNMPQYWRPTHTNHPVSKWCSEGNGNVAYALDYAALLIGVMRVLNWDTAGLIEAHGAMDRACRAMDENAFVTTPFVNCARHKSLGLDYTDLPVHLAYRHYMVQRWLGDIKGGFIPRWAGPVPTWIAQINPQLHEYLVMAAKTPTGTRPTPSLAMFYCPIKGQPITPPPRLAEHTPVKRRVIPRTEQTNDL